MADTLIEFFRLFRSFGIRARPSSPSVFGAAFVNSDFEAFFFTLEEATVGLAKVAWVFAEPSSFLSCRRRKSFWVERFATESIAGIAEACRLWLWFRFRAGDR